MDGCLDPWQQHTQRQRAVATTGVAAESINVWLGPLLVLIEFDMFSQG